jgi:hypothetical protein
MCRRLLSAIALLGVLVLSDIAWAERRQAKEIEEASHVDRVDMGVELRVVVADPDGEHLVPGKPKLRVIRRHRRGGMVAIARGVAELCGPSKDRRVWYCSEDQEPLILHGPELPDRLLVYGSEGAGKTTAEAMWAFFRLLELIGSEREIGLTAPTAERASMIRDAIEESWRPEWYRWHESHKYYTTPVGITLRLKSTAQRSAAGGRPIQGYNWSAAGSDEIQDSLDANDDIEARLRDAPGGRGKRFVTCTAKDHPDFRAGRDRQLSAEVNGKKLWHKAVLLATRSPFMWPEFIEERRATYTLREFQRRMEAMDVPPERQLYYSWAHDHNIRPVPLVGAMDVTSRELAPWTPNASVLVGFDPGKRKNVSLFLKAYQVTGQREPWWFVVDEITTEQQTMEAHVDAVKDRLTRRWGLFKRDLRNRLDPDCPTVLVRADPCTNSGSDEEHPDLTVYRLWQNKGLDIRPASYRPGTATRANVPKEARINMLNSLFCSAAGVRRLFVACDDRKTPAAPLLVRAVETAQRDISERAETEKKDDRDVSHWPAALGYGLWSVEKVRAGGRLSGVG